MTGSRTSRPHREGAAGLAAGTLKGTLWNVATFALSKGSLLVTTIVLARLLPPSDFGLLALGLMVIVYLDVIGDAGVGAAVIYREGNDPKDANTAVVVSTMTSAVLALLCVAAAPGLASVFDEPRLTDVVRVLALAFFVNALAVVQRRKLEKELDFARRMVPELSQALVKGATAVALALAGFGVWSLVWGQVAGAAVGTLLYWVLATWRFRPTLDRQVARDLLRFGLPVTLLSLLAAAIRTLDVAVIGRRLESVDLGYYTIAYRLPELLVLHFCFLASQALFPAYTKARGDAARLRAGFLSTLRMISLITTPIAVGLAVVAPDLVPLLFGDQWEPSVPVTQVLAAYALVYALAFNVGDVYKAIGRPGILNIFSGIKLAVALPLLWFVAPNGLVAVGLALIAVEVAMTVLQLVVAGRVLQVPLPRALAEYVPALLSAAVLALVTLAARATFLDGTPVGVRLPATVVIGAVAYVATVALVSRETVTRIGGLLQQVRGRPVVASAPIGPQAP